MYRSLQVYELREGQEQDGEDKLFERIFSMYTFFVDINSKIK